MTDSSNSISKAPQVDIACLSTAYLAPVEYYTKLYAYKHIVLEQYEHYIKQTYRNRCHIAGSNGIIALTIPTEKPSDPKCPIKDIRLSDHGNWRHLHWNAIESAYNSTPYFEYYKDDFLPFYIEKKFSYLIDFNESLQELVCQLIDLQPQIERSSSYIIQESNKVDDFRNSIHPKKEYQNFDSVFNPKEYYQVFSHRFHFIPNLSIIDLLFNMGPESLLVLKASAVNNQTLL